MARDAIKDLSNLLNDTPLAERSNSDSGVRVTTAGDRDNEEGGTHASRTDEVYLGMLVQALDSTPDDSPCDVERAVRARLGSLGFPVQSCNPYFM